MTALALRRVDDVLRDYRVLADGQVVGEIRRRGFGTAELHLPEGRFLMRRDDTADALKRRAGVVRAILAQVGLQARYSLRDDGAGDGPAVLARAERHFSLSTRRDAVRIWPRSDADAWWSLARSDGLRGPWWIEADGQRLGQATSARGGFQVAWHGPVTSAPVTAFALFVLHQQFGAHPSAGGGT